MEYLRGIPYLKIFPKSLAAKLQFYLTPVTYKKRGMIVFEEGKQADYVAFILSGEFEMVKKKITDQDHELFEFLDEQHNQEAFGQSLSIKRGISTIFKKTKDIIGSESTHKLRVRAKQLSNITMGFLGKGNVFGDADIISNRKYMFTLRVKQDGSSLYLLKSDVFFKFFGQYRENFKAIKKSCFESDLRFLKQLSVVIFGLWT